MGINQAVVVIAGMHRSGTSLTASLLQSAGIFIGDRLMAGGTGNAKGHFEDWDFVDLHREFLTAKSVNREGWTSQSNFTLSGEYLERAKSLIAARSQYAIWGWKDPRTTLFLESWRDLIPHAKFVFVYRSPWDVVDSLFRRGDLIFKTDPEIAIQTWISYNQTILDFCNSTSQPWILLRIEDVINHPQFIVNSINRQLGVNLRSPENLYDCSLFKNNTFNLHRARLIQNHYPDAFRLYIKLHQQATLFYKTQNASVDLIPSQPPWVFQNWLDKPICKVRSMKYWHRLRQLAISHEG